MPVRTTELDDNQLVHLISQASDEAFTVAFERYQQPLHAYCRTVLRDPDEAHDAVQTTMLNALFGLRGERRSIRLRPWLFRAAHNECISRLRRRSREPAADAFATEMPTESAAQAVERAEEMRAVVADLAHLTRRQQRVLILREWAGLPYHEIASVERTSPGHARQAAYEARSMLNDLARGRQMTCEDVTRALTGETQVGTRILDGHLRECARCRRRRRTRAWRALVPTWALPALVRFGEQAATRPLDIGAAGLGSVTGLSLVGKAMSLAGTAVVGLTLTAHAPALPSTPATEAGSPQRLEQHGSAPTATVPTSRSTQAARIGSAPKRRTSESRASTHPTDAATPTATPAQPSAPHPLFPPPPPPPFPRMPPAAIRADPSPPASAPADNPAPSESSASTSQSGESRSSDSALPPEPPTAPETTEPTAASPEPSDPPDDSTPSQPPNNGPSGTPATVAGAAS